MKIEGQYDAKKIEDKIYKLWEDSGFFNPDNLPPASAKARARRRKPFTIIMPPTNANGNLHAGHALVMTIEDIMIRYKRMRGFKALWLPGLDHAGFETQVVYEKKLEKEGRSRFKMAPEELYKEILQFTLENKKNIESQIKSLGASCDWSREKFTLDAEIIKIVYETFEKLYNDGLVYRGKKIINWCAKHQTSLSDLETENTEKIDKLYYLKYGPFTIATARPETKFGDKYVVVHPKDSRYKAYAQGQKIALEWINGPVEATVIKDESIDMDFGTGTMTITPWHDAIDFGIAERHGLDKQPIIDFQGKLLPIAGEFVGMKIDEARPKIIEKLQSKGLVEKIEENYKHVVKTCYKCNTLIEPQVKEQWFLKMKPLAAPAIRAIQKNQVIFIPNHYKKIILHWLESILDWPLSRQVVWGIKIPAWHHEPICIPKKGHEKNIVHCKQIIISPIKPKCEFCDAKFVQDPDVFDTWFSSGQWPFAALAANHNAKDFKTFYPTDVMETAGEIIFFWVARMIMLGLYATKKIPFKYVYLHGLVLDAKGQKMSKSKGNVINPLEITEKYGTDALRIGLIMGNTPGQSLALDENKIKGYRNFSNKIWNASRFVLINLQDYNPTKKASLNALQKKHIKELKKLAKETTILMDDFKFYIAGEKIYHYFWHTFCDKIIEESKSALAKKGKEKQAAQYILLQILSDCLKMLHPFMPFITEEIYQQLSRLPSNRGSSTKSGPIKDKKQLLMISEWPK
ncbi:MAG: valine--tRNA ligase [Candidatus Staskawiczbacteria bacterium RIFCSPLOWO2_01_FULL_40_39]|uniref:Valine--tRNA ligase n=1 Tax=Candidatus Staskawiczbacteria bacterium RIFCSPHIGHO2_01_FULL_39_25 TaxID=1802202 RepID=A0A1G2HNM6_9BACT|nr:MAG: valine--tRNA ligase [Candidatus Staskawiczbacteria bacterium RIFCSPHIGHO2_01_FULL_39_25]OGZ73526.1 MAG: valine--tRNA ligase [Candidatus Staskawiczbacteria bacterium RIFCSPLOWO2_01_FULL_40_39]OGZ75413.1 MAG: valine--tRNA ligase [Candidatus Staskawiczbacteria bacterium RIFCSPLOWO2_02_FULL_39_8]